MDIPLASRRAYVADALGLSSNPSDWDIRLIDNVICSVTRAAAEAFRHDIQALLSQPSRRCPSCGSRH